MINKYQLIFQLGTFAIQSQEPYLRAHRIKNNIEITVDLFCFLHQNMHIIKHSILHKLRKQ
jgi:hypothetical protein